MLHSNPIIKQTGILLSPDNSRVVLRRFSPHPEKRITSIINRVHTLPEDKVKINLDLLLSRFSERHLDLEKKLLDIFESIQVHYDTDYELSISRKLLIGAYFSNEYAFESAALFNPSIVPHPDQSNLPPDSLRFIMSLRAIG
ncbi:MAG TPA: glycosidase, partial [Candidatus Wirthbacteria bacterium]|nr:glycosidase [Candidatus Wirthbacteria bacterium]